MAERLGRNVSDTVSDSPSDPFTETLRRAARRVSDGTHQADRFPAGAREGHFLVDELSLPDRVAMSAGFARLLRFIDLDERARGRWASLFDSDEALLLARIAARDGGPEPGQLAGDGPALPAADLLAGVLALAARIDGWRQKLRAVPGAGAEVLVRLIEDQVHSRLRAELAQLRQRFGRRLAVPWPVLDELWALDSSAARAQPAPGDADPGGGAVADGDAHPANHDADTDRLRSALAVFGSALLRLREVAAEQLVLSQASGVHDPAAALVIVFHHLLATVQRKLNRFTARHADFYVDEVLRLRARPARPDTVHLVARRDDGPLPAVLLPAGTLLKAGLDADGQPLLLRTDDTLAVGRTQVVALYTLRLERDPLISPEHEFGYVNRAVCNRLLHPADAPPWSDLDLARASTSATTTPATTTSATASAAPAVPPHWPLFGGNEQSGAGGVQPARIGLAVASPELLLAEGERELRLSLQLAHASNSEPSLRALVQQHAGFQGDAAQRLALLVTLFGLYQAQERQPPPDDAPTPADIASAAAARVAALAPGVNLALRYYQQFLIVRTLLSQGEALRIAAGRLLAHWLLAPGHGDAGEVDWLPEKDRLDLRERALPALQPVAPPLPGRSTPLADAGDPLTLLFGPQRPDRTLLFTRLFTGLFAISYSGPAGWCPVAEAHVLRPDAMDRPGDAQLQVVVRLRPADAPVVGIDPALHGPGWQTALPVLRLALRPYGGLYAYSLLEGTLLQALRVAVAVRGLRQVVLHNQLGRLDPSKPFNPFGPLPAVGHYLVLGAPELSRKRLSALSLHLQWGGLPTTAGGFADHYAAYQPPLDNLSFQALPLVLRDGQWWPGPAQARAERLFTSTLDAEAGATEALLASPAAQARAPLATRRTLVFDPAVLQQHFRPAPGLPGQPLDYDLAARNGFVRLQLAAPACAFGHAAYPQLLTDVVSDRVRKRQTVVLPQPPYTPLLEGLWLDYAAEGLLQLDGDRAAQAGDDTPRLYHLHAFGVQPVHPSGKGTACRLLPRLRHDGNLYIGLTPGKPDGAGGGGGAAMPLSLLFHLRDESAVPRAGPMPRPQWRYLARDEWRPLPDDHVLLDGTAGFLTSGIVLLTLPEDIAADNTLMPGGLLWLALGVDRGFERFAGLHGVRTQALRAHRVLADGAAGADAPLRPGPALQPLRSVPGLAALVQVGPSFGGRLAESRHQLHIRSGERVRHKQRASLPWDYERLALELCPELCKVKCFSAADLPGAAPGEVLLAVVPGPQRFDRASGALYPRMNAIELQRLADALRALTSPFAALQVRNAAYERIQLRCAVRLAPGLAQGEALQRVERAIFDFLSPWVDGGLQPRFGWVVRQEDIEARLRQIDGVLAVTGLSMLHIAQHDQGYNRLADSARPWPGGAPPHAAATHTAGATPPPPAQPLQRRRVQRVEVRPLMPWSIAVPMDRHMVRAVPTEAALPAEVTGIQDLRVGSNFIIAGAGHG